MIKKKSFLCQIRSELYQGIVMRWYLFLLPVIIGAVYTQVFFDWLTSFNKYSQQLLKGSYGDAILYLFKGIEEYIPDSGAPFKIPVQFFLINIVLSIFIGNYALRDIHGYGKLKLVRCQSRLEWWISKCIWNIGSVLGYYFCLFLGVGIICLVNIKNVDTSSLLSAMEAHTSVILHLFICDNPNSINSATLLLSAICLPLVTSISLSLIQMVLEFITLPSISYIFLITIYIFSTFYMKWFMPGNYMMMYRMNVINQHGIKFESAMVTNFIVIIGGLFIGYLLFKRYDVLAAEK